MTILEYSRRRLQGCLDEVSNHKNLEFPYRQSKQALGKIEATFASHLNGLLRLSEESDPATVRDICITALTETFAYQRVVKVCRRRDLLKKRMLLKKRIALK